MATKIIEAETTDAHVGEASSDRHGLCGLVVFAIDVDRLSQFYQAVLQLRITESKKTHQVLANDDMEVVIHGVPPRVARTIDLQDPPEPRSGTALKPMFRVASLKALRPLVTSNGGSLKPLSSAWSIRGDRVLDGTDCEGNVLQFRERVVESLSKR